MGAADDGEYTVTTLATLSVNAFQCTVAFGLTVLRSSLRWLHAAHRACLVAAQWSGGQANAFSLTMASETPPVIFRLILSRAED